MATNRLVTKAGPLTFIHIPKTGGNSVFNIMKGKMAGTKKNGVNHAPFKKINSKFRGESMGYVFTIVRNPWDRISSAYWYYRGKNARSEKAAEMGFNEWVKTRDWSDQKKFGSINNTQTYYIAGCEPDLIIRFETLNEQWNDIIVPKFKLSELPHVNKSKNTTSKQPYQTYYNQESVDFVADFYKEEIELFGYTF